MAPTWGRLTLWFGRPTGDAPRAAFRPGYCQVGYQLVYVGAGLYTSVFYVKWAHLTSVTHDAISCGFSCVFFVFSSYFRLVSLQSKNHQNSWNSLIITPTTTVDVHFYVFMQELMA